MKKGVEVAGPALDAYLDAELARLGLPPDRLILAGFSQGTMLSLHLGCGARSNPPRSWVSPACFPGRRRPTEPSRPFC